MCAWHVIAHAVLPFVCFSTSLEQQLSGLQGKFFRDVTQAVRSSNVVSPLLLGFLRGAHSWFTMSIVSPACRWNQVLQGHALISDGSFQLLVTSCSDSTSEIYCWTYVTHVYRNFLNQH